MNNWLEYIVPLAAVGLSYLGGRFQSQNAMKSDALRLRYNNFYVPFISKLYAGMLWEVEYSSVSGAGEDPFFDLIFQNISYIDEKTQALLPDYYCCFLEHLEWTADGNLEYENAPEKLNRIFYKITESVLAESKAISKALFLPDISKAAVKCLNESLYANYDQCNQ